MCKMEDLKKKRPTQGFLKLCAGRARDMFNEVLQSRPAT